VLPYACANAGELGWDALDLRVLLPTAPLRCSCASEVSGRGCCGRAACSRCGVLWRDMLDDILEQPAIVSSLQPHIRSLQAHAAARGRSTQLAMQRCTCSHPSDRDCSDLNFLLDRSQLPRPRQRREHHVALPCYVCQPCLLSPLFLPSWLARLGVRCRSRPVARSGSRGAGWQPRRAGPSAPVTTPDTRVQADRGYGQDGPKERCLGCCTTTATNRIRWQKLGQRV
jgi:hypothetical protein